MFSLDNFYYILHNNLISQFVNNTSVYFSPFGTYDNRCYYDLPYGTLRQHHDADVWSCKRAWFHCYFFDQEPIYDSTVIDNSMLCDWTTGPRRISILANSEKSQIKQQIVKHKGLYDWYYFFHGFAALDWYRDFQYVKQNSFDQFTKVFICYNHLISKYRSYRLHLVSNLINQDLVRFGKVSLFLNDSLGTWQDTVTDPLTPLDNRARVKIYQALKNRSDPLIIDTVPNGAFSAKVDLSELSDALWHVVTETVYFQPKLHLTEKVFKPIIAQRPFILVAAPGNLAYLRSYGFKTFDHWIDESYDLETDNYIRIEKITQEIARLCAMPTSQLKHMHEEMQEILLYNYRHFYGEFRTIITNELVDNFEGILAQINNGRMPNNHSRHHQRFELDKNYLNEVKQRLLK